MLRGPGSRAVAGAPAGSPRSGGLVFEYPRKLPFIAQPGDEPVARVLETVNFDIGKPGQFVRMCNIEWFRFTDVYVCLYLGEMILDPAFEIVDTGCAATNNSGSRRSRSAIAVLT